MYRVSKLNLDTIGLVIILLWVTPNVEKDRLHVLQLILYKIKIILLLIVAKAAEISIFDGVEDPIIHALFKIHLSCNMVPSTRLIILYTISCNIRFIILS